MTRWMTHLGGARATIGVSVLLLLVGEWTLGLATGMANALSHILVQVLKRTVARPRPCDANGHPLALIELPDPFSFPSGHAAAATSLAVTIALQHPTVGLIVLPLAAAVAWSRVALRVHYLSDVVAGAGLGLAGALTALALL
jgi:undecaprenyl-diphosphatase